MANEILVRDLCNTRRGLRERAVFYYQEADKLRNMVSDLGYTIEDAPDGSWRAIPKGIYGQQETTENTDSQ